MKNQFFRNVAFALIGVSFLAAQPADETQLPERGEKRLDSLLRLLHVHDCTMSITNGQQPKLDDTGRAGPFSHLRQYS